MKSNAVRLTVLGLGMAVLAACGALASAGPSDAEVTTVLRGTRHMMIGHGPAHSGFFVADTVTDIERGATTTINGTEVFPVRVTLGGAGKTGQFTYLFYKNEFGEWRAEERNE